MRCRFKVGDVVRVKTLDEIKKCDRFECVEDETIKYSGASSISLRSIMRRQEKMFIVKSVNPSPIYYGVFYVTVDDDTLMFHDFELEFGDADDLDSDDFNINNLDLLMS